MPEVQYYDAIKLPLGMVQGDSMAERIKGVIARFKPLMSGPELKIRNQGSYYYLATGADEAEAECQTLQFRTGHPREGELRYDWAPHPDGYEVGTLVEGAR
jgi:hypothetical protein